MGLTERQARAALDHSKSRCVTAGAGTGKTHVLVQKYISLIETGVNFSEILALTFTEKAAGEMKVRVRQAIAEKEGERWDAVRDEFMWAKISTFHSFCASVLREFPIEAGVAPSFTVLDERQAFRLRDEVIDGLVHGNPPPGCREAVIGALRAVGRYGLKEYIESLYSRRIAAEAFFAALERGEDDILEAWQTALERHRRAAVEGFLFRAGDAIETLRDLAGRYRGERDPAETYLRAIEPLLAGGVDAAGVAALHRGQRFRRNMGQKKNWAGDDLERLRAAYASLDDAISDYADAHSLTLDPKDPFTLATLEFLHDLGRVFSAFLEAVEAEKRRINALDFDDLVNRTHRLFSDRPEILSSHFRDRFRFILVDEFQDTDPIQNEIIRALLAERAHLFIVGDPKQSIYLFREADVTQFTNTRGFIERELGGETIALDTNFRSTPEILEFTNAIFGALMAEAGRPWEFLYEPLRPGRSDGGGSVELLLSPESGDRAAGRRAEADMVARKIRHMVESGEKEVSSRGEVRAAGYGDIAILLERRTNLAFYEWALARYAVPYRVHAGLGFYERQEVYDLYNILRFLDNHLDNAALYGLLRSPYFGFSDARLFCIARLSGDSLWERLQADEGADAVSAAATLRCWLSLSRRLHPALLLRRVVEESGVFAVFGGMAGGEQAVANVEKLIAIARDAGSPLLGEFVDDLGRSIDDAGREGDAPLDPASADAVSIMTVHAAKGLEFPVVVVPDLAETPRTTRAKIMLGDGLLLGVSIPNPANDHEREDTPILRLLNEEHRQKEEAERKRLFYVALTRAASHLILSGERPTAAPESLAKGRTRMDWLATSLGLSDEVYERGEATLGRLRIPITPDPADIPVDIPDTTPVCLPILPEEPPGVPAPDLLAGDEERVYSVSEIEARLHDRMASGEEARIRGLVVHEVFFGCDPAAVLRRYGMDGARASEFQELYDRFLASPLMQDAVFDRREVPFLVRFGNVTVHGVIDRLVKRQNGTWLLIDYKTGRPGDPRDHAVQMTIYRHAAEMILGAPVTPFLYFVDADRWVEVVVDEEEVFEAIEREIR